MKKNNGSLLSGILILVVFLLVSCSNKEELNKDEVKRKVGQLFLLAFTGSDAEIVLPFVHDRGIGGLYLSNENLQEPVQAASLLNKLQTAAINGISKQPLLTACDQEGAWGIMVPYSSTGPGNMALGASPVEYTEEMYSIFSKELSAIGVFCDLAPVADVNSNPLNPIIGTRSFGENARDVAERVTAAINGLHKNGIIATAKHFPGHGNTSTSSHSEMPRVSRSLEEIESIDLLPFKVAINSGVDLIMTSHIIFDALDSVNPATLSPKIINEYLRTKLAFKGVLISDSFNMGAIQKYYDPAEAAITAILSGVDMIMLAEERYGEDVGDYVLSQNKMLDKVEQAVMEGRIPMKRIDEAYNRITDLKKKYNLKEKIITDPEVAGSVVGSRENKEAAVRIAEAALYIAFDNKSLIPLKPGCSVSIVKLAKENLEEIIRISKGIGPNYYNAYSDFVKEMKNAGFNVTEYNYDSKIPARENIIAVSENYPLAGKSLDLQEQRKRLTMLREGNRATLINVALKDPYDAYLIKSDAYICAMGSNISNIKAAVNLLSGKAVAKGKLPVTPIKE